LGVRIYSFYFIIYNHVDNTGSYFGASLCNSIDTAEYIQQALTETSPPLFLVAGFERILAMMFHIAMSVLLTLFIMKRRAAIGFCLVTLLHFALDFIVGVMQVQRASTFTIEAVVFVIAIASLALTIKLRTRFGDDISIPLDPAEQAVQDGY
jgi:uncharacterized membrane protein YhfC